MRISKVVTELEGKICSTNVAVEEIINGYFFGLVKTYFSDGIKDIEKHWTKISS